MLTIFAKMPEDTVMFIASSGHISTLKNIGNEILDFYDPNSPYAILQKTDIGEMTSIISVQYEAYTEESQTSSERFLIDIFSISKPDNSIDFEYFSSNELISSQEEHEKIINNSPNKLSQLHVAVMTNSKKNVRELLEKSYIDVNSKNYAQVSPLKMAHDAKNDEIILMLLKHPKVDKIEASTVLKASVVRAIVNQEYTLLKEYLSINHSCFESEKEETLFLFTYQCYEKAIQKKDTKTIEELLRSKLPLTSDKVDPETLASEKSILQLFVKHGYGALLGQHLTDLNKPDCDGKTMMHHAAIYGNEELLRSLIQQGGDIYQKDYSQGKKESLFYSPGKSSVEYALIHLNLNLNELLPDEQVKPSGK